MKCLRSLVGVSRTDRVGSEEVRQHLSTSLLIKEVHRRAILSDQRVLRWFGHVERMDEYRIARRVLVAEFRGGGVRGRPRLGWMDGWLV